MSTKEGYGELRKRHNLPPFDEMEREFSISQIEGEVYTLKNVIQCVVHRYDHYARMLEELLQPDGMRLANHFESDALTDAERIEVLELYKHLMLRIRQSARAELEIDENAQMLKQLLEEWPAIKDRLRPIHERLCQVWERKEATHAEVEYLG